MWYRWRMMIGPMLPVVAFALLAGCASMFGVRGAAETVAEKGSGLAKAWDSVAGLGVLNWGGGILILIGLAGFVLAFTPIAVFEKKAAPLWCVVAGVGCIVLYNVLDEFMWVVYLALAGGAVFAVITFWPAIKAAIVKAAELVTRRDLNKSGAVGDNPGFPPSIPSAMG